MLQHFIYTNFNEINNYSLCFRSPILQAHRKKRKTWRHLHPIRDNSINLPEVTHLSFEAPSTAKLRHQSYKIEQRHLFSAIHNDPYEIPATAKTRFFLALIGAATSSPKEDS